MKLRRVGHVLSSLLILSSAAICQLAGGQFGGAGSNARLASGSGLVPNGVDFISYNPTGNVLDHASTASDISGAISRYLNGPLTHAILTPGESGDYPLDLKPGQVMIAEAQSDAFDPALEIDDTSGKVLAENDDRYPGDQRPLLLWRCDKEGHYSLKIRCFHNKSGGGFDLRVNVYDSYDVKPGEMNDYSIDTTRPFLLRLSLKKGEIEEIQSPATAPGFVPFQFMQTIAPGGLPEEIPSLSARIAPSIHALVAPVDGDYYCMESPVAQATKQMKIRVGGRKIEPTLLNRTSGSATIMAQPDEPRICEVMAKKGEVLEVDVPELRLGAEIGVTPEPDFSKYDLSDPAKNPFYPHLNQISDEPTIEMLPARSGDSRRIVFSVPKDTRLWVFSNGASPSHKTYSMIVKPAAEELADGKQGSGNLRIGNTDYWTFDVQMGDVMKLTSSTKSFSAVSLLRDPSLSEVHRNQYGMDQTNDSWNTVFQKPGRYLLALSCSGDGGSGEYSLSRTVFHPKDLTKSSPAKGHIDGDAVQVWRFTVQPNDPVLMRWHSANWAFTTTISDETGATVFFNSVSLDPQNQVTIVSVQKPQTYVIVLSGTGANSDYSIELQPLPVASK